MENKPFPSRLRTWFHNLPIQDPIERHMAILVQVMLIGFMIIIALSTVLNLFMPAEIPRQVILLRGFISILILGVPLVMLRRGNFSGSAILIITVLLLLETYAVTTTHLRAIVETLSFFTLAIIMAGLLLSRQALLITFLYCTVVVLFAAYGEPSHVLKEDSIVLGLNFVLLNGLIGLFLDRFGVTLRTALTSAMERENDLQNEINIREQAEAVLKHTTAQLEILHEIDRALLSPHSLREIADNALVRICRLIQCSRASVTLLNMERREATFLAANFHEPVAFPETPISFEEFG